ncbi:MAG: CoA pyrophosphatase [Bacteroidales bacterium]
MSQYKMAPFTHNEYAASMDTGTAGVLVLLFPRKGDLFTLLIKRTEYPGPHSGQISLPGGKSDKTDKSQIETALREAREETGIEPENITVLGTLTPLYIPVSNLEVLPVVGYTELQPEFRINKSEVEYLIHVPLQHLIRKNTATEKPLKVRGKSIHAPGYLVENEYVWGATAMILSEFIEIAIKSCATRQ